MSCSLLACHGPHHSLLHGACFTHLQNLPSPHSFLSWQPHSFLFLCHLWVPGAHFSPAPCWGTEKCYDYGALSQTHLPSSIKWPFSPGVLLSSLAPHGKGTQWDTARSPHSQFPFLSNYTLLLQIWEPLSALRGRKPCRSSNSASPRPAPPLPQAII